MTSTERLCVAVALGIRPRNLERAGPEKDASLPPEARRTAAWFPHFVDDAMFVERTAQRYGVK